MKYIKARKDLLYTLTPLFVLIGLGISWFYARGIAWSFYFFWIVTFIALLLLILPLGNKRLTPPGTEVVPFPKWFWLPCIILTELCLAGMYWGMSHLVGQWLVINSAVRPHLFSTIMPIYLIQFGLFPWALYAVITVSMSALAYRQQIHAYLSNLLKPFFHQHPQEPLGLIANVGLRRCVIFVLGVTLMFFALLLMSFMDVFDTHIAHGFEPAALLMTAILVVFSVTQIAKKAVNRLFSRHIATSLGFPMFGLALAVIILFLSAITFGLMQNNASLPNIPNLIQQVIQKNWLVYWMIFSGLWWLYLTPAVCSLFARISVGYRVRDVVTGILILPFTIAILYLSHQQTHLSWPEFSPFFVKIVSLISFLIGLPLLVNHRRSSHVILAYFSKHGVEKPRDHYPFFQRITQLSIIALYFYLTMGMNALSIYFFSFTYLIALFLWLAALAAFKNIK